MNKNKKVNENNKATKKNNSINKKKDNMVYTINKTALDCAMLNNAVAKKKERFAQEQDRLGYNRLKEKYIQNKRKAYDNNTFYFISMRMLIFATLIYMMFGDNIKSNPAYLSIAIAVAAFCLITSCIRFGVWFGVTRR